MKIGIVSAEPSGDLLGSNILRALSNKFDNLEVIGIGGGPLKEFGLSEDRSILEIMGLVEPLLNFHKITSFRKKIITQFLDSNIDIFIGIDAPDFNFEIHKKLKAKGIKTIHVVCPSVWAWRPGRVKHFKHVDYMLCLFPFEMQYCVNVEKKSLCIGHPLAEDLSMNEVVRENQICIMPGSRRSEIKYNLPAMIQGFKKFNKDKNYKAVIPVYKSEDKSLIDSYLVDDNIICEKVSALEILQKSKAAIICSGTATLEALIAETPATVVYKMNWLNHFILKQFVSTEFASLPNIIADEEVFSELIQSEVSEENIAEDLESIINDLSFKVEITRKVKEKLIKPNFNTFAEELYEDSRS